MICIAGNNFCEKKQNEGVADFNRQIICSVLRLVWWLDCSINRYLQRQHLARLEPDRLRDLGLTQGQVNKEVSKPFWK